MTTPSPDSLTTAARRILEAARLAQSSHNHPTLRARHWLQALLERVPAMLADLLHLPDGPAALIAENTARLEQGDCGPELPEDALIAAALELARARDKLQAAERDVATVVINALRGNTGADGATTEVVTTKDGAVTTKESAPFPLPLVSSTLPTPMLDAFGRDLTADALAGKLPQIAGRQDEIQLVVETLCRRTKRNPALVGPAGVGKTAIVEGLAQRIADGRVPTLLKGVRLIALQPSVLVAGIRVMGELEERMRGVIREASQPGVVLFIDEFHTIMGAGGMPGLSDLSSALKPALARGDLACIAATTGEEYRRFIETDTALERRFQPVRIQEPSAEETFQVLQLVREDLQRRTPVGIDDDLLQWMVEFSGEYMRNRHFPDKAIDLLEQSHAHAVATGQNRLDLPEARQVAERMVGMPAALDARLAALEERLRRGFLPPDPLHRLITRLQVNLRGLDLRAERPNAVILLAGPAAADSESLAEAIAAPLYGDPGRVITIDFSRMTHPADISLLVGAPPGYVGYSDRVPLHDVAQTPWCVLRFLNIDACYPSIRQFVASSIASGRMIDGRGRAIYLSDTVILLTAAADLALDLDGEKPSSAFGFGALLKDQQQDIKTPGSPRANDSDETWSLGDELGLFDELLGPDLTASIDLALTCLGAPDESTSESPASAADLPILNQISEKYLRQGVLLQWDASLLSWLEGDAGARLSSRDLERWADLDLGSALLPFLSQQKQVPPRSLTVRMTAGRVEVVETLHPSDTQKEQ